MSELQERAEAAYAWMEKRNRSDDSEYWCFKDGAPDEYNAGSVGADIRGTLVWAAHDDGEYIPDDQRYQFLVYALGHLADTDDIDGDELEADVYAWDLLRWVGSNLRRVGYCDEAISEYGGDLDFVQIMTLGRLAEMREVFEAVKVWLKEHATACPR